MSKPRMVAYLLFCGSAPILWGGLVDGEWPSYSAQRWAIWLSGLVVIIVGSLVIDSLVAARRRAREAEPQPSGQTNAPAQ